MLAFKHYLKFIKPYFITFVLLQLVVRLIFFVQGYTNIDEPAQSLFISLALGFIFDLVGVFVFVSIPITAIYTLISTKFSQTALYQYLIKLLFLIFNGVLLFISIAEYLFWDEFTARFNFIAVDYLIYTQEVIGNIKESYPILPLITAISIVALLITILFSSQLKTGDRTPKFLTRCSILLSNLLLAVISFFVIESKYFEVHSNEIVNQISKNGMFEFLSAFRNNELPYNKYYITKDDKKLRDILRNDLQEANSRFVNKENITRKITHTGKENKYNIVLITVESLSAEYMKIFGQKENLTPNLDKLTTESLFFKNFYAIGTRTVYGLSAINLSIPPIPGNAIIRRTNNENLFTLGEVLNQKGYTSKFLYGGFGYFDNMNYFFSHNGYQVFDRADLSDSEITFSNIWGVCDEDLLARVIKENDKAYAKGKPFFDVVMTTSNHRPFTYPEGKIDIPSKSRREGGVKYSDFAIGQFIEQAKTKPWFDNTIFVITADHTAGSAGKIALDPKKYHIPLIIYAPKLLEPQEFDSLSSQIDLAPTILSLLNMNYESKFFGLDLTRSRPNRALISNYQQIGYITNDKLIVLKPVKEVSEYQKTQGEFNKSPTIDQKTLDTALSYFQNANNWRSWNKISTTK